MEPSPGITETSLPSDLGQKRKTGPTREEAVCKGLAAKRRATITLPHPWIWSYLPRSFPGASRRAQRITGPSPRAAPRGERRPLPTPTLVMPHN